MPPYQDERTFQENPKELDGVSDLCQLIHLAEPNVLHNLNVRYTQNPQQIYTSTTAKVLIAVNPYEKDPNRDSDVTMARYQQAPINLEGLMTAGGLEPHTFTVANAAYHNMIANKENQSVIVCGESGSGKTESAKLMMKFLAYTSTVTSVDNKQRQEAESIGNQVLDANPILESFGNAKTVLNNNSSRFGKFTKMLFADRGSKNDRQLVGAAIETYLLEKSRVVRQDPGERNYHVFYYLCAMAGQHPEWLLDSGRCEDFHYLNQSGCTTIDGDSSSDVSEFSVLIKAMDTLNISKENQASIFNMAAGILHLGNINFTSQGESCTISNWAPLKKAAKLFQVDPANLAQRLTHRNIRIRNEAKTIVKPLNAEDAEDNRDSIAKALYDGLFLWIVNRINKESNPSEKTENSWIGTLDVFGFEIFENNSFEQFCINFANERLQQFFNYHVLKAEQELYRREALLWTPVDLPENQDVIDLILGRPSGILATLDSACQQPKGSVPEDQVFTNNVFNAKGGHPRLDRVLSLNPRTPGKRRVSQFTKMNGFSIKHYAGTVVYNAKEFVKKNMDSADPDTVVLFSTSNCPISKAVLTTQSTSRGSKFRSTSNVFSSGLEELMRTLKQTTPYFVRCIKPNDCKQPKNFNGEYVKPQLRCGGLVEALRIIKCGFPTRCSYERLHQQFGEILDDIKTITNLNKRDFTEALIHECTSDEQIDRSEYQLGLSMIFFRPGKQAFFQKLLELTPNSISSEQRKRIHKFLIHKRIVRMRGTIKAYLRVQHLMRFRRLQKAASIYNIINKTMFRTLRRVRGKLNVAKEQAEHERLLKDLKYQNALKAMDELKALKSKQEQLQDRFKRESAAKDEALQDAAATQAQMKTLKSKTAEMQAKIAELEGSLQEQQRESSNLQNRLQTAVSDSHQLQQELSQSQQKAQDQIDELNKMHEAMQKANREAEMKDSELHNLTIRSSSETSQLQQQLEEVKAKYEDDMERVVKEGQKKQSQLEKELEQEKSSHREVETELQNQVSLSNDNISKLTVQLENLRLEQETTLQKLTQGDQASQSAAKLFAKEKQRFEEEIEQMRKAQHSEVSKIKDKLDSVRQEKLNAEENFADATNKIQRLEDAVGRMEQKHISAEEDFRKLLSAKDQELNTLLADKQKLVMDVEDLQQEAQKADVLSKQQISNLKNNVLSLEDELEQEKMSSEKSIKQLKKELQTISQGEMKELRDQLYDAQKQLESAQAEFSSQLQSAQEENTRQLNAKVFHMETVQKELESTNNMVEELQAKLKQARDSGNVAKSSLQMQVDDAEEQLEGKHRQLLSVQNQLKTSKESIEDLQQELQGAKSEITNLRDQSHRETKALRVEFDASNQRYETLRAQSNKQITSLEAEIVEAKESLKTQKLKSTRELNSLQRKFAEQMEEAEQQWNREKSLLNHTANGATEAEVKDWKNKETVLKSNIQTLTAANTDLEAELRVVKEEARRAKHSVSVKDKLQKDTESMYESQILGYIDTVKKSQKKLEVAREQFESDMELQVSTFKSQVDNLKQQNRNIKARETCFYEQISELKSTVDTLNRQLHTNQMKYASDLQICRQKVFQEASVKEQKLIREKQALQKRVDDAEHLREQMEDQHKVELDEVEATWKDICAAKLRDAEAAAEASQQGGHFEDAYHSIKEEYDLLLNKELALNSQFSNLSEEFLQTKRELMNMTEKFDSLKLAATTEKEQLTTRLKLDQMQADINSKATLISTQRELEVLRAENDMLRKKVSHEELRAAIVATPSVEVDLPSFNKQEDVEPQQSAQQDTVDTALEKEVDSPEGLVNEEPVEFDSNEQEEEQDEEKHEEDEEEEHEEEEHEEEEHEEESVREFAEEQSEEVSLSKDTTEVEEYSSAVPTGSDNFDDYQTEASDGEQNEESDDGNGFDLSAFPTLAFLAKNESVDSPMGKHMENSRKGPLVEVADKENANSNITV
eukprot:CAMPEP_0175129322 /NCGR_PEP_ID=MMETSP0087-20121206/5405_1 /TAXON_ID=136419 /ORGANISM="Unknown Unknown, Strain D1" /LENGTH=1956 /DNA_ID=CAMNT_0016411453 /DNA_START=136 /DNA_END=6006 /DNA_ORIENTATION=+